MFKTIVLGMMLLMCSQTIFANDHDAKFSVYPSKESIKKRQPLVLDQQSKLYRTTLKNMAGQAFNFSSYFVAETYGCGGGCEGLLVYNGKTGRGLLLKDQFADCYSEKHGFTSRDILFQQDSRLIIAVGNRKGEPHLCEEVHYLIEKDQFKQIKQKWLYR